MFFYDMAMGSRATDIPPRRGAYLFSRAVLPLLLASTSSTSSTPEYPPTLIFTGATASMKGSALCSSFATGKFALRALAQSLGREFGPKGVHVAHVVVDGVIDIERTKGYKIEGVDGKISPGAVSFFDPAVERGWRGGRMMVWGVGANGCRLRTRTGIFTRSHERPLRTRSTSGRILRSGSFAMTIPTEKVKTSFMDLFSCLTLSFSSSHNALSAVSVPPLSFSFNIATVIPNAEVDMLSCKVDPC